MNKSVALLIFIFFLILSYSFVQRKERLSPDKPALVVGIVVDQMRYDYLYRYFEKYGNGGFKRLLAQGYSFENTKYNYVPTTTGPGHASIYTGSTPSLHGIAGNEWFVRETGKNMYVTEDSGVESVGVDSKEGKMSPKNLLSTTITDELKLFNNFKSKVIGIALKDRGSILPAGHVADGAYWYDGGSGKWITSTFYAQKLPQWVVDFNNKNLPDAYLSEPWNTLLPIYQYTESLPDDQAYKMSFKNEAENKFPHNLPLLRETSGYDLLRSTPFGDSFTLEFALQAMESEKLGKGKYTDFLTLSFSSPDYIGHNFGVYSIEVEDNYLRMDLEIEKLLNYLDKNYGKENVLVFLTADHGGAYTPKHLTDHSISAGRFKYNNKDSLNTFLKQSFGEGQYILAYKNSQLYLNKPLIEEKKVKGLIEEKIKSFLMGIEGVSRVVTSEEVNSMSSEINWIKLIQNGIYPKRSGDISIVFDPAWFENEFGALAGTNHGSGYNYDRHIPNLWYGWNIKKGSSAIEVDITDIASTIAGLLNISAPNASTGKNLEDYLKNRKNSNSSNLLINMTYSKFIFLFLLLLCTNAAPIWAQSNRSANERAITHLKKFRSDYIKSLVEKKPEIIVTYYADTIRLMPEFQKTVIGKSNALTYHKAFLARFEISSYARKEMEILDLDTRVLEVGLFTMKVKLKSTGKDHEINGKYQNIWKKIENGNLVLITEAWNYSNPLPIEDQLRFGEVPVVDVALHAHVPINNPISFELAALNRLMEATVSQHDAKIWSQFYTEDGMFLYSRSPVYEGKKALDEFLEEHVKELPVFEKLDIRNDKIDNLGDYVIEYASHIAIIRNGDFSGVFTGKDLRIWRREKGGYLKIFRHIGMYD